MVKKGPVKSVSQFPFILCSLSIAGAECYPLSNLSPSGLQSLMLNKLCLSVADATSAMLSEIQPFPFPFSSKTFKQMLSSKGSMMLHPVFNRNCHCQSTSAEWSLRSNSFSHTSRGQVCEMLHTFMRSDSEGWPISLKFSSIISPEHIHKHIKAVLPPLKWAESVYWTWWLSISNTVWECTERTQGKAVWLQASIYIFGN